MSYNGSGTFQINTSGQPVVAGTVISATAFNALTADLATGLSTAITKDGQTTTTARIPFAAGISSTLTTDSSSVSTGSIITAGGVGVAKNLYVGANVNVAGTLGVTGVATLGAGAILNTPASATLTNATGLPLTTGVTGVLPEASGGTGTTTGYYGFKNRIINGAMVIDQRNAGASVTVNSAASLTYSVDRFYGYGQSSDGVFTLQQNSSVPTGQGFAYSLKATVTTADASIGATQIYQIGQRIEGYNVADFELGLASAATFTFSFWVRSSLTGTFGGALQNGGQNRSYPFSYTISAVDTWEKKTITLTGDTSGTWLKTNGTGLEIIWGLGVGSTYLGTANAWAGSYLSGVTGQTQVISTVSATFYITGVQLEKGSTATSFDYRPYGTELALCQRYFATIYGSSTVYIAAKYTTSKLYTTFTLPVTPRATPSVSIPAGAYYAADYNFANFDSAPTVSSTDTTATGSNVNVVWNISWNPASNYIFRIGANTASNLYFSMEL